MHTISIGNQSFEKVRLRECFYIDKTSFIKEWWENEDEITLITRPRRFGKTFNLSMMECFFSIRYENRKDLFEGLEIWREEKYRNIQGKYPVINISFAELKSSNFNDSVHILCEIITDIYDRHRYLLKSDKLEERDKRKFEEYYNKTEKNAIQRSLNFLCSLLEKHFEVKPLIFMDEYDTPLQEAWLSGYWDEMVDFTRGFFNSTFKTNPYLGRAIITGITRISKESLFSDMNNLEVVTVTSDKYATCFGFTEDEVFSSMDELGIPDNTLETADRSHSGKLLTYNGAPSKEHIERKNSISEKLEVKQMYDGFVFGRTGGIYNPWSITNYFDKRILGYYWKNTSTNALAGKLILNAGRDVIDALETLIKGSTIRVIMNEQLTYNNIMGDPAATFSLLLATGYLTAINVKSFEKYANNKFLPADDGRFVYELKSTNKESLAVFKDLVRSWFSGMGDAYNYFIKAMLDNDLDGMNEYINSVAKKTFSYFDTAINASEYTEPEKFYHGFVLGLLVDLWGEYQVKSNRESGKGRYDVMIIPLNPIKVDSKKDEKIFIHNDSLNSPVNINKDSKYRPAYILEFKVHDKRTEKNLEDTAAKALEQIEEKQYETELLSLGIPSTHIHKYGFAFRGKEILIKS